MKLTWLFHKEHLIVDLLKKPQNTTVPLTNALGQNTRLITTFLTACRTTRCFSRVFILIPEIIPALHLSTLIRP